MPQKSTGDDRRNYFRIDIDLPLELRPATMAEQEDMSAKYLDDLDLIDLDPIPPESVNLELKEWMRMVNDKLNIILTLISNDGKLPVGLKTARVNLSASGMSFFTPDASYRVGGIHRIKLTLEEKRSSKTICLFSRVVVAREMEGKNIYKVAVEFISVGEDITQELANFIMNRERAVLRNRLK